MTAITKSTTKPTSTTLDGRWRARALATVSLAAAVWLTATAAAQAQAVASAKPAQAGKASRLHWAIDGGLMPIGGQIPTSLAVSAPPGFRFDPRAAAKRCTPLQAKLDECPRASRIGSAVMAIHVEKPTGPRDLPINIRLYLGPKNRLLAVTFLGGVRVIPGSISGSNGIVVTFNPLPTPPPIPEVSYTFLGVSLDLGTYRTITPKVKGRKKGKASVRKIRIDLVRNPRQCALGTWAFSSAVGLPDGTAPVFASPGTCSGP